MHEHLLNLIAASVPLTAADSALVRAHFEPISVPKNTVLEQRDRVPQYLYWVHSGFVRLFRYNDFAEELTTHINCPPGFITAYSAFSAGVPSAEVVATLTDCQLLRISKASLEAIMQQSEVFRQYSLQVFSDSLLYNEQRAHELATLTAEQRYRKLLAHSPEILQHVPVQYIASFLGMKPESLSRIRRKIS